MAEIAVRLADALARRRRDGTPGGMTPRVIARGEGWSVSDVICTAGPDDRPFAERHERVAIGIVLAGTFQYRCSTGHELMTPGSLLLGNPGDGFECGHQHGEGDRCLAFWYERELFDRVARDAGVRRHDGRFTVARLSPLRDLSLLTARGAGALSTDAGLDWETLSLELAAGAIGLSAGAPRVQPRLPPNSEASVARVIRRLERRADMPSLAVMAREARLSAFHFLRVFERVTGLTPHQYLRRLRLRAAAARLTSGRDRILDIAFDAGFGDVSNFNRAFRTEFGMSPRAFRASPNDRDRCLLSE